MKVWLAPQNPGLASGERTRSVLHRHGVVVRGEGEEGLFPEMRGSEECMGRASHEMGPDQSATRAAFGPILRPVPEQHLLPGSWRSSFRYTAPTILARAVPPRSRVPTTHVRKRGLHNGSNGKEQGSSILAEKYRLQVVMPLPSPSLRPPLRAKSSAPPRSTSAHILH